MFDSPEITASFRQRKEDILKQLALPSSQYHDKSPKGSVDVGIRQLIEDINRQDGLVTTSSCAGRISVFLEGRKKKPELRPQSGGGGEGDESRGVVGGDGSANGSSAPPSTTTVASSGGKGGGGTWLYISHDPVPVPSTSEGEYFHDLFGLSSHDQRDTPPRSSMLSAESLRYVHFKFEPMILHVLATSLLHAQMVLTAASQAGFRESGAINLVHAASGAQPMPMVGIRCLGLGFDSIVGYLHQHNDHAENQLIRTSLVTENHLRTLVDVANGRFVENARRMESFRTRLLHLYSASHHRPNNEQSTSIEKGLRIEWEDAESRRERKRAEGLRRQLELRHMEVKHAKESENVEVEIADFGSNGHHNAQETLANR
ncbi:MAG: hypothetical protein M1816_006514 [Peltula sp. TS41687]|nr:MAG: hypothetical protein M1816_006514 [Peltula sp. TS41687]